MKFGPDISGAQKMDPTDFVDYLNFYQAPAPDQNFHSSSDISQNLIGTKFCRHLWLLDDIS